MALPPDQHREVGGASERFTTTHWSVVLAARPKEPAESARALETLCRVYWYPLYAFVRRRGYPPEEAQDLTQSFFARVLEKDYLSSVDRRKGKFRSFLLAALDHFLANEWRNSRAKKRGGGAVFISIDDPAAEQQYSTLSAPDISAEKLFERQWATTLLEEVLLKLRAEFSTDKAAQFDQLKGFLIGEKQPIVYAELAENMGMSEAALKMAVSRMRRRYAELLRNEIADTVGSSQEIEEELHALFAALSS